MLKKLVDITISLGVIIFFFPIIVLILLLVFITTGESPVFLQERKTSLEKNSIKIIKIRTIRSSNQFLELQKLSPNAFIKISYKKYVPLFCQWLRKTGLDEILQVINVLKGEMSLVGPRPLQEKDLIIIKNRESALYYKRVKINSKPGIAGYWQVYGNRLKGTKNLIELDEKYEKEKSLSLDLNILSKTFLILITATHSDAVMFEDNRPEKSPSKAKTLLIE